MVSISRALKAATVGAALLLAWVLTPVAAADTWFPHPAHAKWQYRWSDTAYNPSGTVENVIMQQQQGQSFTLAWADSAHQPPQSSNFSCPQNADMGVMSFQDTNAGLVNTNWQSCPPPSNEPILCSSASGCPNSLSSALFNVIWGSRAPVLSEPLLQGTTWNSTGGYDNSVTSSSRYIGHQLVKVPAFPAGVIADVVRSQISQAGALGDPYGSGIRTTWWVAGVGPVRVQFQHSGGNASPVTNVYLLSTSLHPSSPPSDANYFPLRLGLKGKYRWTNSRYMRKPEIQKATMDAVANRSARVTAKSVSGPIRAEGQYGFSVRLDGVTNIWGSSAASSLAKFPKLGHGRHFFTVLDLMTYGFDPVLPAYIKIGESWHSGNARDMQVYGVRGTTKILGTQEVHVPAGTFQALKIRSTLTQKGHAFGSGTRTMWFAAGHGLVKLVFRHRDGSVSTVQLIR